MQRLFASSKTFPSFSSKARSRLKRLYALLVSSQASIVMQIGSLFWEFDIPLVFWTCPTQRSSKSFCLFFSLSQKPRARSLTEKRGQGPYHPPPTPNTPPPTPPRHPHNSPPNPPPPPPPLLWYKAFLLVKTKNLILMAFLRIKSFRKKVQVSSMKQPSKKK